MTINGHVENGRIVLDDSVPLTEGMKVRVELLHSAPARKEEEQPDNKDSAPTLYEALKPIIGSIKDLPPDYAKNIDHYLYGAPKK